MDHHVLVQMRNDWNTRALENAEHYVANAQEQWERREFFRSGEISVANEVMPDMVNICGGSRSPLDLHMLEIGCGVGRMTRMLARIFETVTALDISDEMLAKARTNLEELENVHLVLGDGQSLADINSEQIDFAFSFIVFQHIPSLSVIESYCREVHRVLKPGSVFKFQVQGAPAVRQNHYNTWTGVAVSLYEAQELARKTGFVLEAYDGVGTQYFWLRFKKAA